jgi:MoaA/NifB/PqqE/SkfB family radical SAM enzyme
MSEVTLFQQEIPAYLKRAGMDDLTKSLAGNTGLKRISIRGGVFRMMVNGEEIAKNEGRAMNIVIVNGGQKHCSSVLCW